MVVCGNIRMEVKIIPLSQYPTIYLQLIFNANIVRENGYHLSMKANHSEINIPALLMSNKMYLYCYVWDLAL